MKVTKFLFLAILNASLIFIFDNRWNVGTLLPPLGKFMSPFVGFWANAELSNQGKISPNIFAKELLNEADVIYDKNMIPHIFAKNDQDLYFLQGYVTAQHRLWQMEFQTHAAAGRLTEIMGKKIGKVNILDLDRRKRRIGIKMAAQKQWKHIQAKKPLQKAILEAYTNGVNAYIETITQEKLPIEYKLLDYQPEPWTPLKSILIVKQMAEEMSFTNADLEYTNALNLFGRNYFELFYPETLPIEKPIVTKHGNWSFTPLQAKKPKKLTRVDSMRTDPIIQPNPRNGSNNWAITGSKTANGNSILCSDPHLSLNLPSIWYQVQLNAPSHNVYGVSLPGCPFVIIGFNHSIAWGMTNALRDVVDWYKITFKDKNQTKYKLDDEWREIETMKETYKFYNKSNVFEEEIKNSVWGPIVYDRSFKSPYDAKNNLALRWAAHDISDEVGSLYAINRSKNRTEFVTALRAYGCPAQNFAYADIHGDIMMRVQGHFPLKWKEQGKFVMDGSRSENKWKGYIPQNHAIESVNPDRGYVFSANQRPADKSYPYYTFSHHYGYHRDRRITELLDSAKDVTYKDMMQMQNDNYNFLAADYLKFLLSKLDTPSLNKKEQHIFEKLTDWDYHNDPKKTAPSYFQTWISIIHKELLWDEWKEKPAKNYVMKLPRITNSIHLLREQPDFAFMDITKTKNKRETAGDIIRLSFAMTADSIMNWKKNRNHNLSDKWENYKNTRLQHLIPTLSPFHSRVMKNGGVRNAINAMSDNHGPSWRMIVELDKVAVKAWGVYPGGQSGNLGSPFYLNFATAWEQGNYYPLWFMDSVKDKTHQILLKQKFTK